LLTYLAEIANFIPLAAPENKTGTLSLTHTFTGRVRRVLGQRILAAAAWQPRDKSRWIRV